jgi:hypothetical protein
MSESFLSDAGSLFFAAWILIVAAVSIVAFGRDLFPPKAHIDTSRPSSASGTFPGIDPTTANQFQKNVS